MSEACAVEKQSDRMVIDKRKPTTLVGVYPYDLYLFMTGLKKWFEMEIYNHEGKSHDWGVSSELPSMQRDMPAFIVKLPCQLKNEKSLQLLIDSISKHADTDDVLRFFGEHLMSKVKRSGHQDAQAIADVITTNIEIIKTYKNSTNDKSFAVNKAKGKLFEWWFSDKLEGPYCITRWTKQECNLNQDYIDDPLTEKIKEDIGDNVDWNKHKVGALNIFSPKVYDLNYDQMTRSNYPCGIRFHIIQCESPKRPIKPRDPNIVQIEQHKQMRLQIVDGEASKIVEYTFNIRGMKSKRYYFMTCDPGKNLFDDNFDDWAQDILDSQHFVEYVIINNWQYWNGLDEFEKLDGINKIKDENECIRKKFEKLTKKYEILQERINDEEN